jgi:hypothetical protein
VRRASFVTRARSAAPPQTVFALLADAPAWQEWAGPFVPRARWEPGTPAGAGAVRRLGLGRLSVREQVVVHEPPHAFSYVLLTGVRWHGYRADVRLDEDGHGGTRLEWTGRVSSPLPGVARLLLPVFRGLVEDLARRLAREAERVKG